MKLSDYVFDFVARQGVKHVFMLSGGGAMHLVDSVGRNKKLTYVCNLHEQACAIAAEAYSQYTNNLGVALVTTGPGGTNTLTGIAGAWLDSSPMLIISGQVKRQDMIGNTGVRQMGFQEINITQLVSSITKYAVTIMDPTRIRYELEKAVHLAKQGRPGPVWVDIPLDVQAAQINEKGLAPFVPERPENTGRMLKKQVNEAISLLKTAARPVILAGNGIRLAGAQNDFLRLIETLDIPVLTTWKTLDFLADNHRLYAGRPGAVGQRGANFTQQNADWLLILGARMDFGQTAYSHENFAPSARKIMVDIDPAEIYKLKMNIDIPVQADVGDFIREFLMQLPQTHSSKRERTTWLKQCKAWQKRYPVILPEYWKEKGFVNDYVLIDVLSDELKKNDLLVPGSSGACSERTMQAFRAKAGLRVFNTEGLGSMGFGISAAIGGCLASGKKRTVCIEGDGGFIMNIQELETVKRLNLPIIFFVLNNDGYVSIQTTQKNYFNGHYVGSSTASGMTLPDVRAVAKSFGCTTARLTNHAKIREKVRDILNIPGPVVCEVMVSPEQITAPRVSSKQQKDGSMISMPMEDLWPFLDREELKANMLTQD